MVSWYWLERGYTDGEMNPLLRPSPGPERPPSTPAPKEECRPRDSSGEGGVRSQGLHLGGVSQCGSVVYPCSVPTVDRTLSTDLTRVSLGVSPGTHAQPLYRFASGFPLTVTFLGPQAIHPRALRFFSSCMCKSSDTTSGLGHTPRFPELLGF